MVSASLAVPWAGSDAFSPNGFSTALAELEGELGSLASPGVVRLRRYAMLDAIGDTPKEKGETVRRLYLDGAAQDALKTADEERKRKAAEAEKDRGRSKQRTDRRSDERRGRRERRDRHERHERHAR